MNRRFFGRIAAVLPLSPVLATRLDAKAKIIERPLLRGGQTCGKTLHGPRWYLHDWFSHEKDAESCFFELARTAKSVCRLRYCESRKGRLFENMWVVEVFEEA